MLRLLLICIPLALPAFEQQGTDLSDMVPEATTQLQKKLFKCPQEGCSFVTAWSSSIYHHKKLHHIYKQFTCSECSYSFHSKANLEDHIRIHTGEKPFNCTFCPYATGDKSNLSRHIRRKHTQSTPSTKFIKKHCCIDCDYSTNRISDLTRHQLTHTQEKPWICEFCYYASSDKDNLKRHIDRRHRKNPFIDESLAKIQDLDLELTESTPVACFDASRLLETPVMQPETDLSSYPS